MTEKKRLTALAGKIAATNQVASKATKEPADTELLIANKPHGSKGDHIKITVTLPPEVYKLINDEAARRKMVKEPDPSLSAVIRECVVEVLQKKIKP